MEGETEPTDRQRETNVKMIIIIIKCKKQPVRQTDRHSTQKQKPRHYKETDVR